MYPHTLRRLGAASLLLFVAACQSDQPVAPETADISDAPVNAVATVSAVLAGSPVLLAVPDTVQLTVRNTVIQRSKVISWRTTNSAAAIVTNTGRVIATGAGSAQIVASGGGRSETTFLTVVDTGVQLTTSPSSISLTAGGRAQISPVSKTATGTLLRYRQYTYQSHNAAVASVDADGLVTGFASGATQIEVSDGSSSSMVPVSVNGGSADAASVVGFSLTPASVTLNKSGTRQFATLAVWSDGVSRPVAVTYTATGGNVSVGGLFTAGQAIGAFTLIATCSCGLADTSLVSVSSVAAPVAQLASLTMTPAAVSLAPSATQDFVVTALWSDGGTNLPPLTFTTNGGTVTPAGRYTAPAAAGTYRVIVSGGGKADTSLVTVTSAASSLTSLSLTPATATLSPSATLQFNTSALWSNGSTALPTRVYSANGGTVTSTGLYTAPAAPGTYRVIVSSGIRADTSIVSVSATAPTPTLSSLQISPATVTLQPGASQQFTASALWSNGGTTLPAVTYTATGGTVTTTGAYTAPSTVGTYKVVVRQSSGTVADTSTVTVATVVTPPTQPGNPAPSAGSTILIDTRAGGAHSIQDPSVQTFTDAMNQIKKGAGNSSPGLRGLWALATNFDGAGTKALRLDMIGWCDRPETNYVCEKYDGGGTIIPKIVGKPKEVFIQWKHFMGRTPTGGGRDYVDANGVNRSSVLGRFAITNDDFVPSNASRKYLLIPRDVPDGGSYGRLDLIWAGIVTSIPGAPRPVMVQLTTSQLNPSPGTLGLNKANYDPKQKIGQTITFTAYMKASSAPGVPDGIFRIWFDGVLVAEKTNYALEPMGFDRFEFPATFNSPRYTQTEYFWDLLVWKP